MDFANFASQLNAGTILPEGIVMITLLGVLIVDLILGRTSARWIGYLAIAQGIATANIGQSLGLVIALVFVIAGIGFKISAAPFHQWTPDVYEGAPTPVIAFLSVGSKTAGFALAIRLLTTVFPIVADEWRFVFTALAVLSMILGNVVALAQTSMKRMLAYSSIAQAGFVMIGLIAGTDAGYSSMIFYLLVYLFMNLCAFSCVVLFSLRTGTDQISEYSGLYQKDPLLTLGLSISLLFRVCIKESKSIDR